MNDSAEVFWDNSFKDNERVSYEQFFEELIYWALQPNRGIAETYSEAKFFKFLRAFETLLIQYNDNQLPSITKKQFLTLMEYFGPLEDNDGRELLYTNILNCRKPFFHGFISTKTAELRLNLSFYQQNLSFLIRCSSSVPGVFTLSVLFKYPTPLIHHIRIPKKDGKFKLYSKLFESKNLRCRFEADDIGTLGNQLQSIRSSSPIGIQSIFEYEYRHIVPSTETSYSVESEKYHVPSHVLYSFVQSSIRFSASATRTKSARK